MLKNEFIKAALKRYHDGNCSEEERQIIEGWYQEKLDRSDWDFKPGDESIIKAKLKDRIYKELLLTKEINPSGVNRLNWFLMAGAAAILILAVTAVFYFSPEKQGEKLADQPKVIKPLKTAQRHAILTLANGETKVLDGTTDRKSIHQDGAEIRQSERGGLTYQTLNETTPVTLYHTLSTPKGVKYRLDLPDGTKIWLNAASSITYPTAFSGHKRTVSVTGEVYFEVAHDIKKPFLVKTPTATVTVLGTHFNVNTYSDEPGMKTTLLEGKVKITQNKESKLLEPGEQANVDPKGGITILKDINEAKVMGWKDGKFVLDKVDVHTLMRQLARWYDLEIIYKGEITQHFWGTVSQEMTAAQLFQMLESTGAAHFKLEGSKVTVSP